MSSTRNYLNLNDRVRREGEIFRPVERLYQAWVLMRVVDGGVVKADAWYLTDKVQQELRDGNLISIEENFFSKAAQLLSTRNDDSDMNDLDDAKMRTVAWKVEWCTRFNRARAGHDGYAKKPALTPKGLGDFIERERENIHRWFLKMFRMPRPPGRLIAGSERKFYDYPSPTTLREWLSDYEAEENKQRAFKPGYHRCGRRDQLDERLLEIITRNVDGYASRSLPSKVDIFEDIDREVIQLNRYLPAHDQLSVSERSIRRRINRLPPMFAEAGRLGPERASRKYTAVGQGIQTYEGLEKLERMGRVEMDDWEMDLFAILEDPEVQQNLDAKTRKVAKKVDRKVRCTITIGIDVITRCIVALNVTPDKPSTMGSRRALDSMFIDKTVLGKVAGAETRWPKPAKPREVCTDGGPAFDGDFHHSVIRCGITHRYPGGNPTSRGHIESFFRTFKRFCREFTGQAFSNVVERGDYDAENMASIMAHDIELLIVRFILDDYHRKPHSGLGGMTPYTAWERSSNKLVDPPDVMQRHAAFGVRKTKLRIRAPGITFMHIQYKHPRMATLYGHVGKRELTGIFNPNDLGTLLVLVPEEVKRDVDGFGDYLAFTADNFQGVPLARLEDYNAELRRFAEEERRNGRSIRYEARQALKRAAQRAREDAGVPSDLMTQEQYDRFTEALARSGVKASSPRAKPEGEPMSDADGPDTLGVSVARPRGTRRLGEPGPLDAKPAPRKSINRFRDEERQ